MKKQLFFTSALATCLGGCVSSSDFNHVQTQVSQLQQKVGHLEGQLARSSEELATTKTELALVKKQRVVRLPTGAPTETRQRNQPDASNNTAEDAAFQNANSLYKSGDIHGAIRAFDTFNAQYPQSAHRTSALFYLAQATYTARDYGRSQAILEPLVFQPVNGHVSLPSANLLKMVYQAQGNTQDERKLNEYLQVLKQRQATAESPTSPVPTENTVAPTSAAETTIIERPSSKPLRPANLNY